MTTQVHFIPEGRHTLAPYLIVNGAAQAIEFYAKAFAATELHRLTTPDGKIAHCEFKIGDSILMMADENLQQGCNASPATLGGSPVKLHIYVANVDSTFDAALQAGAKEIMPPANQFWGDRMAAVTDPFGHLWLIGTHIEDVDPSEYQSRMEALFAVNAVCD